MQKSKGTVCETIVVDNNSRDGSAELVETHFPDVKLIKTNENLGFAGANNKGFQLASGRYIVLLNSDAFLHSGALKKAIHKMDANPEVGLAGAKLVSQNGSLQPSARLFPSVLNDFLYLSGLADKYPKSRFFGRCDRTWSSPDVAAETDWVPGAFSIIRRASLEKVGFFDERFFLYYEEVDLCRRIKAMGDKIVYWPDLVVTHLGGESSKTVTEHLFSSKGSQLILWRMQSGMLYYRKHHGYLGAGGMMLMELAWHQLRAWKNALGSSPANLDKRKESLLYMKLLKKAWKETQGGLVCPPKPW